MRVGEVVILVAIFAVPVVLVMLEPDLGVALTYLPVLGAILVLGGLPRWVWVVLIVLGILGVHATWRYVLKPYQKDRVLTVIEPAPGSPTHRHAPTALPPDPEAP